MLEKMHKHMAWMMWTIVGLVTVTFLFFNIYPSAVSGRTVAKVDGYVISIDDFNRVYRNMEENYRQIMKGQYNESFSKILKAQALQQLVQDRLLVQKADRLGLRVSDAELQAYIMQTPAFMVGGKFDKGAYGRALQYINVTPAVFESSQREYLLRRKLEQLVEDGVTATDAELAAAYAAKNPKAKPGDFEKNKESFRETYLSQKRQDELEAFVKNLENKAVVKINDKALAS